MHAPQLNRIIWYFCAYTQLVNQNKKLKKNHAMSEQPRRRHFLYNWKEIVGNKPSDYVPVMQLVFEQA